MFGSDNRLESILEPQYEIVKGKLKGGLTSIRKLKEILPQAQLFLVYQALLESHLRYGNLIWGHLPRKTLLTAEDTRQGILPY